VPIQRATRPQFTLRLINGRQAVLEPAPR